MTLYGYPSNLFKNSEKGAGEMTQTLKALDALAKDLGTHTVPQNHP